MEKKIIKNINIEEDEKFYIKTEMEQKDHRHVSLFMKFFKKPYTLLRYFCISFLLSLGFTLIAYSSMEHRAFALLPILTVLFFLVYMGTWLLKVEMHSRMQVHNSKTDTLGNASYIRFYDNFLVSQVENLEGYAKMEYNQFIEVVESKRYYLFYRSEIRSLVIRKIDVDNISEFSTFLKEKFGTKYLKR